MHSALGSGTGTGPVGIAAMAGPGPLASSGSPWSGQPPWTQAILNCWR